MLNVQHGGKAPPSFHIPALDGIRAIAFLMVFLAHAGLNRIIPGGFGVTIFFFLSGYLITTLLRMESDASGTISLKNFYLRRCRRILPPMYVTLAVAGILGLFRIISSAGTISGYLSVVFYYANYVGFFTHNAKEPQGLAVVWSLMVEEHFYFVFPLLYLYFLRNNWTPAKQIRGLVFLCTLAFVWRLILVFLIHIALGTPGQDSSVWTYVATDSRFDAILWGCILAIASNPWYGTHDFHFLDRYKGVLALLGLAAIFATFAVRNEAFRQTARYSIQSISLYFIFYYCIMARSNRAIGLLDAGPLRRIGQLSYAMYLSHLVILLALPLYLKLDKVLIGLIGFALTFSYAELIKRLVEDPLRRRGRIRAN